MEGFSKNNDKGFSIMVKMGYKPGAGLGKDEAGMLQPINASVKNDKRGFGHDSFKENQSHEVWDGKDKINIEEELIWIHSNDSNATHQFSNLTLDDFLNFIVKKEPLTTLENEIHFCDPATLRSVLKTKEDVFLTLDAVDLSKARQRANQFETIKSAFFMNRAALKMANIDAATGFMFTNIDKDINHKKKVGPYYFADVCAGPGGFSEYILWRKKWSFKGFGLTLKGVHDFKVCNSTCASDVTFRGYYGSANDGNACNPCNISDFTNKILHETDKIGVHFMMSDGGFSVEGNEGIQEILSKQIYICQCLIALEIVRKHGHFVTKLFDIFTTFSVGLMFLMYQCFEKVAVLKPNSSRPANSERYFICSNLKDSPIVMEVRNYLRKIVNDLWNMRKVRKETDVDIVEIIPLELIKGDSTFYNYIRSQNTKIAEVQTESLRKLALFCKNPNLIDEKQVQLRSKCLEYWHIPNLPRAPAKKFTTDDLLNIAIQKPEYLYVQSRIIKNLKELQEQVVDVHDWIYVPLASSMMSNNCHIFAGVGAMSAYKLQNRKWVNVKGLKLVKGTLLFGEIVTEISSQAETTEKLEVKTLHVIDALRLGDISLADLDFQERSVLIQTYCKSINFETAGDQFRIRPKLSDKLINIHANSLIHYAFIANALYTHLPTLGYGAFREHFIVNSILLLKTGENHFFNTTYVLRTQVFLEKSNDEEKTEDSLQYDAVLQMGDDVQKISVIHDLPQLIMLDSSAVYNRIIPKIRHNLPTASCEFQIATSAVFMLLLQRSANTAILQSIIQGLDAKDPNVAFAWSEALYGSMSSLPELMIQNFLLPLARQKFQPNSTVISKVFCSRLIGEICSNTKFRVLDVKRDILPIAIGLCQDGHPEVRSQMCMFLPKVAAVLGHDWEKTNLLSCIVDLAQDENLNVRSTSIIAITSMLKILSQETSRTTLLPLIKKLCTKACEESLVTALILSDEFGALMHEMPPINDQDVLFFVRIYKQLSLKGKQISATKANASIEVSIRQKCATNIYGILKLVLQSLPAQVPEVYGSFRDHAIDPCYLVRRAAAGVLADIANLLGNENMMMRNEIVRLLRDDAVEVLDAVVPTISSLFTSLVGSGAISYAQSTQISTDLCKALIKCQNELAKRYNWRLSVEYLKQLEILPTCVPGDYIHNNFTPTMFDKLIYGKAKPIRIQAARTLVVFMRYNFQPNQSKWIRESLIRQTAQSRNCHARILYFYVCEAVLSVFSEKFFKEWFLGPCLALATDQIVNVRWKFMQFSSRLKSMVTLANDLGTKQKILDSVNKLESREKNRTVLEIIRSKKREAVPKYAPEALREEALRVRGEGTTNIMKYGYDVTNKPTNTANLPRVTTAPAPDMRFLAQHFYIDAGIKLESIIGNEITSKHDTHASLDPTDLIAIETCNITDDAKANKGISKLIPPTSYCSFFDSLACGDIRSKRFSSIISATCLETQKANHKSSQRRHSLNLNNYCDSKIPIANRFKSSTITQNATKEEKIENDINSNARTSAYCKVGVEPKIKHFSLLPLDERRRSAAKPAGKKPPSRKST